MIIITMPYKSKSQLSTCYGGRMKGVNCDKWLRETPSVCCLPYRKGGETKSRCLKVGERVKSKVKIGPRGGRYFTIKEKDSKGKICEVKVYLPKS